MTEIRIHRKAENSAARPELGQLFLGLTKYFEAYSCN